MRSVELFISFLNLSPHLNSQLCLYQNCLLRWGYSFGFWRGDSLLNYCHLKTCLVEYHLTRFLAQRGDLWLEKKISLAEVHCTAILLSNFLAVCWNVIRRGVRSGLWNSNQNRAKNYPMGLGHWTWGSGYLILGWWVSRGWWKSLGWRSKDGGSLRDGALGVVDVQSTCM